MAEPVVVPNVLRTAQGQDAASSSSQPHGADGKKPETENGKKSIMKWSKSKTLTTMRCGNCCNGALLVTAGIIVFLIPGSSIVPSASTILLSSYICFLGLMMTCVEINLSFLQSRLRQNFGFMFSYFGRCVFLLFTATVAVALGNEASPLMWAVGCATGANAIFNFFVILFHPAFREDRGRDLRGALAADPSASASSGEAAVAAYLMSRPQLLARVMTGMVTGAAAAGVAAPAATATMGLSVAAAAAAAAAAAPAPAPAPLTVSASAYDPMPNRGAAAAAADNSAGRSLPAAMPRGVTAERGARVAAVASGTPLSDSASAGAGAAGVAANPFGADGRAASGARAESIANPFSNTRMAMAAQGVPDVSGAAFAALTSRAAAAAADKSGGGRTGSFITSVEVSGGKMTQEESDNPFL